MSIQTDDFGLPPPDKRVMSAAAASPNEEAVERALAHLLRHVIGPVAWLWPMSVAAAFP